MKSIRLALSGVLIVVASHCASANSKSESLSLAGIGAVPTPEQRAWQELELTMFVHFGVNTFTDREWGEGTENPKIFNPVKLDCRQWVRTAKDAGFKLVMLTAKHHDGFCLWPSKFTEHSVKNASWKNGRGDVVREFTTACRAEGIKVGLYLSPWDRHEPSYGTDAYNEHFRNQLTELLTQYGKVDEVWFDGACGEGPNGKRQVYDWPSYYAVIRKLAPHAVIAITGPDVRWAGNESGVARIGETSVQSRDPNMHGHRPGKIWYPSECDVSIRPGWFYHAKEDTKVKSVEKLLDIYFKSVGRNSVLLLNVPPNRDGLFADPDVRRLHEFGLAVKEIFRYSLAARKPVTIEPRGSTPSGKFKPARAVDGNRATFWSAGEESRSATLVVDLKQARKFNLVSLGEPFWLGERVQKYRVEAELGDAPGGWQLLAQGSVIGTRNLLTFPETTARRVRLVIEQAKAAPAISEFAVYHSTLVGTRTGKD